MIVYNHNGTVEIKKPGRQIGWFNSSASVERTANLISDNISNMSMGVLLNYLALHGKESSLDSVIKASNPFGSHLDNYLAFGKITV